MPRVVSIVMACVTLHNMQNHHRHGSYEYDDRLHNIAARVPAINDVFDNNGDIDVNINVTGIQRQLHMIEIFNENAN